MIDLRSPGLALCLLSLVPAQDPRPAPDAFTAAKTRLHKALDKTAALPGAAFAAQWGPEKKQDAADDFVFGAPAAGRLAGSWRPGLRHCLFDDNADELLSAGGRTIARDAGTAWTLRAGRFADGTVVDFLPDPALLLEQLATWDLAVVHREVGSLDDRPVETVTVTLSPDQVAEALYIGLLPPALAGQSGGFGAMVFQVVGGRRGARPAPPPPDAVVDLAVAFDPATDLVQRLHFRSWSKQDGTVRQFGARGGVAVVRVAAGVQIAGQPPDEGEEPAEGEAKPGEPLRYENGLPLRPRRKMAVVDYTVRLTEHGAPPAIALDDATKKLLRL